MKDKATSPEPKRAYCTEPDGCPWTACDCPLKTSSFEHQEKPFLTEEDKETLEKYAPELINGNRNAFFDSMRECYNDGYKSAASKANARISSLESELKAHKQPFLGWTTDKDILNQQREYWGAMNGLHKLESEIKALREERDRMVEMDLKAAVSIEKERDKFALDFTDWMMKNRWYNTSTNQSGVTLYYQQYTHPTLNREYKTLKELLEQFKNP